MIAKFEKKMDYKAIIDENIQEIKKKFAKKEDEFDLNDRVIKSVPIFENNRESLRPVSKLKSKFNSRINFNESRPVFSTNFI